MKNHLKALGLLALACVLVLSNTLEVTSAPPSNEPPTPTGRALLDRLQAGTAGKVRISYHNRTGQVRFVGTTPEKPIIRPASLSADATPEQAARQFLSVYGALFGLTDQAQELIILGTCLPRSV